MPEFNTVVTDSGPEPKTDNEPSQSGKALVGIIYPPPQIRSFVDKTAEFVARNGPEFEERIRQHPSSANDQKFSFLKPDDPYNTYYLHKVRDFAEGKVTETPSSTAAVLQKSVPQKVQEAIKAAAEFIPKDPPPQFEFVSDPATLSAFDLDVIKLTAQFVARNGRQFLTQLMSKESRNYQFDFLKPQHSNFAYFTKLVEQYTKILLPPKDIGEKLTKECDDPRVVYDMIKYRVEWERYQRRLKEKEDAEAENERLAYAAIDWHDFVVVQTVDFQPHETLNLPPPCTPKDVGSRILAQQRLELTKVAAQVAEMEVESGESDGEGDEGTTTRGDKTNVEEEMALDEEPQQQQQPQQPKIQHVRPKRPHEITQQPIPAAPKADSVNIRKDYNPHLKQVEKTKKADDQWVISPLTGERIPADKLADHLRFNTVDPQYFAQRQREMNDKQDDEPVYASGMDIDATIKKFADRRTDIFGVGSKGAEQTIIGKKLGEEDKPRYDPKAIWDGHATGVDAATKAAQGNVNIEEQIAQIHRAQGLLDDQEKERIGPHSGIDTSSSVDINQARPTIEAAPVPPQARMPPMHQQPERETMPPMPRVVAPPPMPQQQQPRYPHHTMQQQAAANQMLASFAMRQTMPVQQPMMLVQQPMMLVQQPTIGLYAPAPQMQMPPGPQFGGYAPQMGQPMGGPMNMGAMGGQQSHMEDDGPSNKRQKTEDQLVPEKEWLEKYGNNPIMVRVEVPMVHDKPEWKLHGQMLTFSFPLTEQIQLIKTKIEEATTMPASKQKLVYDGIFIKDSKTLAFYNMVNGSAIQLQLKERGGRKK